MTGVLSNITATPVLRIKDAQGNVINQREFSTHYSYKDYFNMLFSHINDSNMNVQAIGHRVVHGGLRYKSPTKVSAQLISDLKKLISFAPLHQPFNIEAIEVIAELYPNIKQFACFDTAFHRTHLPVADFFGIPREYYDEGVRRYGFHGLSYEYIMMRLTSLSQDFLKKRIIVAHLGNGASMCAIKNAQCHDSTMGFTALDGLLMGTRCGTLDPGVLLYLIQYKNMDLKALTDLLYKQSGLLGVSTISSNMQELLQNDKKEALDAIELFAYRIRKEIGALASVLGGLDTLVFTGGIGENAAFIREKVCKNMDWVGLSINDEANLKNEMVINTLSSKVDILVIPTDEEFIIANHTYTLLNEDINHG